jgi:MoaA/NifB/PqqE/SkfB family radical SAM enzyme
MALGPHGFYNILDHHHPEASEWAVVNWNLGNMCNYSCSYCPPVLNNGSFGWNDLAVIKQFVNSVVEHYAPRTVYFEFTGGEVTLWKDFVKCAEYIKSLGHDVGFISNASRTIRWWENNKNNFDHVCLSFHPEHADPDHFFQVVEIMSKVCRTHVNVMGHTNLDMFDAGVKLSRRLADNIENISMAFQPLVVDFGEQRFPYTDDQQKIFDEQYKLFGSRVKHTKEYKLYRGSMDMLDTVNDLKQNSSAHRFIVENTNNWKGWDCWAGVEQIIVDFDGGVWRGWCRVGGPLGRIQRPEQVNFPLNPIRCNKKYCHCNFDIMCKKVLPESRYEVIDDEDVIATDAHTQ